MDGKITEFPKSLAYLQDNFVIIDQLINVEKPKGGGGVHFQKRNIVNS